MTVVPIRGMGPKAIEFFESRRLSTETAARFGIYTARWDYERKEAMPDIDGNIIVFPFTEYGATVGEKYRTPDKRIWQRTGGRRTFYNADALDDPALETGQMPLVIVEGEPDCLAAIDCGFPLTVSVPDGAPALKDGEDPNDLPEALDPKTEKTGKFEFLYLNRDRLRRVRRFIIAVDNDRQGQRLAAELVRRLSPGRCSFVTYPDGCKDLNAVLMKHGVDGVVRVLNGAQPYPVRGLYRLSEYPPTEEVRTFGTGWHTLDAVLRPWLGEFMVVTGIPGHGKSTWVLNLLANMAHLHGWRSALFSPEMPTVPHLRDKLRRIRGGWASADPWIEEHFTFIDGDPSGTDDEQDFNMEWIIDRATDAVLRDGIQAFVLDPFNEVEHARRRDESMTEYIGRTIRMLKRWGRLYNVLTIVIAHPTKDIVGRDGKTRHVTLYDIEGSAHWFNKCDHGIVVDRPDANKDEAEIRISKVRFDGTGRKGMVRMGFDPERSRFTLLDEVNRYDDQEVFSL